MKMPPGSRAALLVASRWVAFVVAGGALGFAAAGCASTDPALKAAERGPQGTVAFRVLVEANEPGVRIEANKDFVGTTGTTPVELKIFGDKDGTFHCFDNPNYIIQAIPTKPGQLLHSKYFRTGDFFTGEDKIPRRVFFNMAEPEKSYAEGEATLW
jgi:hypothetical protein